MRSATSFVSRFTRQFANATMKNKWMSELEMLQQLPNQTVSEYALKFKTLMSSVDPMGNLDKITELENLCEDYNRNL